MIIYFSGTGNSEYVAMMLGEKLNEPVEALVELPPADAKFSGKSLGFVFPVYSWGVPPLVLDYVRNLNNKFINEIKEIPVYIICVCGDETAYAPEMIESALAERGIALSGGWSIQMPNNYVLLPGFDVDSTDVENSKLETAPAAVAEIAEKILKGELEKKYVRGSMPWIKSKLVYPAFKRWEIFPDRWHATDACVSCGKCVMACPMNNIEIEEAGEHPKWGKNCVSCLACYHICPRHAVQYGKITRKKGQYFCPF